MAATFDTRGEYLRDLVARFVSAPAMETEDALARLYTQGIEPRASAILKRKLRVTLRRDDDTYLNQVGLDLLSDVKAALLPVLRRMTAADGAVTVANFDAYVRAAVLNAYNQHIREKHPHRLSLRNKIRYALAHRTGLAIWKSDHGEYLCGTSPSTLEPAATYSIAAPGKLQGTDENARLVNLVSDIVEKTGVPVRLEDLVSVVWDHLKLGEYQPVADSEAVFETLESSEKNAGAKFDEIEHLNQLWSAILEMPVKHRRALLLNLTDGKGDNLIVLFPALGIATVREIAAALEYELEKFVEIWSKLPMDDRAIGEMLGATRQQVINLRQTARAKLRRSA